MHPRFELPAPPDQNTKDQKKLPVIICHFCGEHGHKAMKCQKINTNNREVPQEESNLIKPPIMNNYQEKFDPQNHFLQKMFPKKIGRCYMLQMW